jgi:catechol 2,3-dioxygenase-like lactoylglutathione lyase family enzyme
MAPVLNTAAPTAFIPTTDPGRARTFYEETLGLDFVSDEGFALVFDVSGTMLRVTRVEQLTPQPFTVLGWRVNDVSAAVSELAGRGVTFQRFGGMEQDAHGIWESPSGARAAWFKDPDGNLLSISQHPKS